MNQSQLKAIKYIGKRLSKNCDIAFNKFGVVPQEQFSTYMYVVINALQAGLNMQVKNGTPLDKAIDTIQSLLDLWRKEGVNTHEKR